MSARKQASDLGPTIERLRKIAAEAQDHLLLADGEPNPDAELLDLCADALDLLVIAARAWRDRPVVKRAARGEPIPKADYAEDQRLHDIFRDNSSRAMPPLRAIRKLPAKTAAGVFAKAMVVRASRTGAPLLAMSLAEDLISNPTLRRAIWPADPSVSHNS